MARRRVKPYQLSLESEWAEQEQRQETVQVNWRPVEPEVTSVFTDGGLASNNPSKVGGSWAYVLANAAGEVVGEGSGFIEPGVYGLETITNNVAELWAVMIAMADLPVGWSGTFYTDSQVTLRRLTQRVKWAGVPDPFRCKVQGLARNLGRVSWVLLGGHPNAEELEAGVRKDGAPVHLLNVRCDWLCKQEVKKYLSAQKGLTAA